jgi:hypothetical protein
MRWAARRGCHTLAESAGALIAVAGSSPRWLLAYPLAAGAGLLASARLTTGVDYHAESGAQASTWPSRTLGSTPRLAGGISRARGSRGAGGTARD